MRKEKTYSDDFISKLERLIDTSKTGDNALDSNNIHFSPEEEKIINIMNRFVSHYDVVDENERVRLIQAIKHRDDLLQAVNEIASILLQSNPERFVPALQQCMGIMVRTMDVDRMYIWKNHVVNDELYCTQIYEWSEDVESQQDNEYTVDVPYSETTPELIALKDGNVINGLVREMAEGTRNHLGAQGIVSVLMIPLFIENRFWGFVGFDDCRNERIFTKDDEAILRSGSLLIANAILRNELILHMRETSAQLELALTRAHSASQAKSDFLSNMSHEMRTPLNAIIGMTTIGKRAANIEQKNHSLDRIGDASSHLLGVINDVLDMAKIEANKLELSPVAFDFRNMLQKVINIIHLRAEEAGQQLNVSMDRNVPYFLFGDDQRLAQVITNLLSNAVKFTPEGGIIQLDTKLLSENERQCKLQIRVSDTGIGITDEQKARLFQSFEQAESGTSRKFGGTGLGLAISKSIVEMMDGKIWIESELNQGTTFTFTIIVKKAEKEHESFIVENAIKAAEGIQLDDFSDHAILLAEDIEINREIILALLEETNLVIEIAENGVQAFHKFVTNPNRYDMIFMDLQMPEMDGLEATRRIRSLEMARAKEIPIVAMTANVFREDIESCFQAGMNQHIGKPIDIEDLLATLRTYLIEDVRTQGEAGREKVYKRQATGSK